MTVVTSYATIEGPISQPILLAGVPAAPISAPQRDIATSNTQIVIDIAAVTNDNGSPILSYHIEMDNGRGGSFTELQGYSANSMSLTVTKAVGIYPGLYYRVRYQALNAIGWSGFSDISYIMAARLPDTPVPPTITLWQGTNIRIVFYLPFNGASVIT